MHRGRLYPQFLTRWNQPDCGVSSYAPEVARFVTLFPGPIVPPGLTFSECLGRSLASSTLTYWTKDDDDDGNGWSISVGCETAIDAPGCRWLLHMTLAGVEIITATTGPTTLYPFNARLGGELQFPGPVYLSMYCKNYYGTYSYP